MRGWSQIGRGHFRPGEQGLSSSPPGGQGQCRWPGPGAGRRTQVGVGTRGWADPGQAVRARSPLDTRAPQVGVWAACAGTFLGRPYGERWTLVGFTLFPGRQPGSCPPLFPQLGPLVIRSPFPDTVNFHLSFQNWILEIRWEPKTAQILKENKSLFHECVGQSPGRNRRAYSVEMGGQLNFPLLC